VALAGHLPTAKDPEKPKRKSKPEPEPKTDDDGDLAPMPGDPEPEKKPEPKAEQEPDGAAATPQDELEMFVTENGHNFEVFRKWCVETGNVVNAARMIGFGDVPASDAKRFLRSYRGLMAGLDAIAKGGLK
jgi:hypothetical protein